MPTKKRKAPTSVVRYGKIPPPPYRIPGVPESRVGFETIHKQTKGKKGLVLVVSTRLSRPLTEKERKPGERPSKTVRHKTFHEKIYKTRDVEFSSRRHYVKLTRAQLLDAANVKRAVAEVIDSEAKRFAKSKYEQIAASVQLVSGKIVNADTGFIEKKGFASKAIKMQAEKRQKRKLKRETLKQSTYRKTVIAGQELLNDIEDMALELHGTNLKKRKPKPYKKAKSKRREYRQTKRTEGESIERANVEYTGKRRGRHYAQETSRTKKPHKAPRRTHSKGKRK